MFFENRASIEEYSRRGYSWGQKTQFWMKHETHIPTEQTETATEIRIPRTDEDSRRPQGHPPSPPRRTEAPLRLNSSDKLKKRSDFLRVSKQGSRLVGKYICIDYRKAGRLRFGITASTKFGNSPERSRFKRLVREAFRTSRLQLPQGFEFNVIPRQKAKEAKMGDIRDEWLRLLSC